MNMTPKQIVEELDKYIKAKEEKNNSQLHIDYRQVVKEPKSSMP